MVPALTIRRLVFVVGRSTGGNNIGGIGAIRDRDSVSNFVDATETFGEPRGCERNRLLPLGLAEIRKISGGGGRAGHTRYRSFSSGGRRAADSLKMQVGHVEREERGRGSAPPDRELGNKLTLKREPNGENAGAASSVIVSVLRSNPYFPAHRRGLEGSFTDDSIADGNRFGNDRSIFS